jgi:hypothetical protein
MFRPRPPPSFAPTAYGPPPPHPNMPQPPTLHGTPMMAMGARPPQPPLNAPLLLPPHATHAPSSFPSSAPPPPHNAAMYMQPSMYQQPIPRHMQPAMHPQQAGRSNNKQQSGQEVKPPTVSVIYIYYEYITFFPILFSFLFSILSPFFSPFFSTYFSPFFVPNPFSSLLSILLFLTFSPVFSPVFCSIFSYPFVHSYSFVLYVIMFLFVALNVVFSFRSI